MAKKALYLAGGGARGAYQAGVLKAINQILQVKKLPFDMLSGVSIGGVNVAIIAQHADDFEAAVNKLETLWREIHCQHVFNSSNYQLGKSVFRNLGRAIVKQRQSGHLLDTAPLHKFILDNINFDNIREHIATKQLKTIEIITNCYETQQTISFYQHHETQFEDWQYSRHVSQRADINKEHILATGALPLFFPAVKINGYHYGDGSMGLVSPLRGALRFDINKVMIIGTRPPHHVIHEEKLHHEEIGFAHVLGNMLNGLFIDNLDRDIEMVNRMNDIARLLSIWKKRRSPWRPIETLHIRPSVDLAQMAQSQYKIMPSLLRLLLNLLGAQNQSGDLLSFLLFETEFTSKIIDVGYHDAMEQKEAILAFFD